MQIVISENKHHIYIGVSCDDELSLSWEQLQKIKNKYYPNVAFVEVYPKQKNEINKANERHLFHVFGCKTPDLSDIEVESKVKIFNI